MALDGVFFRTVFVRASDTQLAFLFRAGSLLGLRHNMHGMPLRNYCRLGLPRTLAVMFIFSSFGAHCHYYYLALSYVAGPADFSICKITY